ncbi:glycosyltransferase family 2 protein [Actinoplanes sp. LDG1-06]|uniref:Glycosyltransferase family 2 protein n=1 Tax=Paractinoplanes ovalisporus TaxID=2810368 RepID=A0ABS2AEM9_9ACTN|nr:glycosyltransferase family A protein [Actinoplanes ovalisporus]MBM2618296.1 glycosyltransferase family 2 protein [Actinoplanes ovalisporus]
MSLLSVVVPVYNEEDFLGPCLDAVLAQHEPVHEVIVVDNNSTDRTAEVLTPYAGRVIVLREPRQGVQHARNRGFDAATGDVIGRIDADTRLPPDWSRRVRRAFDDPRVDAVTGPATYYDVALAPMLGLGDAAIRRAWSLPVVGRMDWLFGANMAIRASAWRTARPALCAAAEAHEDVDLGIHLSAGGGHIAYAPRLRAATSARRIADRYGDYRRYLLMSEAGYRTHRTLVPRGSQLRAWITARLLLALFPLLRLLFELRSGGRVRSRKNPMAHL